MLPAPETPSASEVTSIAPATATATAAAIMLPRVHRSTRTPYKGRAAARGGLARRPRPRLRNRRPTEAASPAGPGIANRPRAGRHGACCPAGPNAAERRPSELSHSRRRRTRVAGSGPRPGDSDDGNRG